jgi:hypothetical protein
MGGDNCSNNDKIFLIWPKVSGKIFMRDANIYEEVGINCF